MITDLVLHNYRQYKYLEVKFGPGLNVIRGQNNSGKTTLLESIAFALFGPRAIKDTGRSWIRAGEKSGSVTMIVDVGEVIKIYRSNTEAKLWVNDKLVTQYKNEATDEIGKILGLDPRMFLLGYNIRQKEIDFFSSLTKGRKKAEVERLLSISRVDNAISIVSGEAKTTRTKLFVLSGQSKDVDLLKAEKHMVDEKITAEEFLIKGKKGAFDLAHESYTIASNAKDSLVTVRELVAGLEVQRKALSTSVITAESKIGMLNKELDDYRDDLRFRDAELKPCLQQEEAIRKEITALEEVVRQQDEREGLVAEVDALIKRRTKLETKLAGFRKMEANRVALQEQVDSFDIDTAQTDQDALNTFIDTLRTSVNRGEAEIANLRTRHSSLGSDRKCPVCASDIDPEELCKDILGEIASLELSVGNSGQQLSAARKERDESKVLIKQHESRVAALTSYEDLDKDIDEVLIDINEVSTTINAKSAKIPDEQEKDQRHLLTAAKKNLAQVSSNVARYHRLANLETTIEKAEAEVEQLSTDLAGYIKSREDISKQLDKHADVSDQWKALEQAMTDATALKDKITAELDESRALLETCRTQGVLLETSIAEQRKISTEIAALNGEIDFHEEDIAAFKRFKKYVGEKVLPKVREVAEQLFHEITHNRYRKLVVTEDYELKIVTHEGHVRSLKSISGSEEDVALLCLRLALSTLAAGTNRTIDFILLDEITASFDNGRTESTVAGILTLRNLYKQILWITHKEIEEQFADSRIVVSLADSTTAAIEISH